MVKDSTGVRSPHRKLTPDIAGLEQRELTTLRGIATTASFKKQHRFGNLYGMLNAGLLLNAWRRLNKRSAIADEELTVEQYAENLEENLLSLTERLRNKRYRAKLVKRQFIEKANGKLRPLGIPALEDKIVQKAVGLILEAIYEQDFLDCSYGYRTTRGAKDAVSDLTFQLQFGKFGYVVEADIKGFFDNIDHDRLMEMLNERISDKPFLNLIRKWLKAGVLKPDGAVEYPESGTPQGGIVSPILANIYLHEVLDKWFVEQVKPRLRGDAFLYRYADDWICGFQFQEDADRFYQVVPKRLGKFGLELEPSKTQILRFSRFHPGQERKFTFLGFDFYWGNDRNGKPNVKRRTSPKKYRACVRKMGDWMKAKRSIKTRIFLDVIALKLRGHYNYYGIFSNSRAIHFFYEDVIQLLFKWLNRRSQKRSYTWPNFRKLIDHAGLPKPRITEKRRRHCVALG